VVSLNFECFLFTYSYSKHIYPTIPPINRVIDLGFHTNSISVGISVVIPVSVTPYYFYLFFFFFFHIKHLKLPFLNSARHVNFTWNTDSSRFSMKFEMIRNMRSLAPNLGESKRCSFWLQNGKFWN
jgi:hypothetical protein